MNRVQQVSEKIVEFTSNYKTNTTSHQVRQEQQDSVHSRYQHNKYVYPDSRYEYQDDYNLQQHIHIVRWSATKYSHDSIYLPHNAHLRSVNMKTQQIMCHQIDVEVDYWAHMNRKGCYQPKVQPNVLLILNSTQLLDYTAKKEVRISKTRTTSLLMHGSQYCWQYYMVLSIMVKEQIYHQKCLHPLSLQISTIKQKTIIVNVQISARPVITRKYHYY